MRLVYRADTATNTGGPGAWLDQLPLLSTVSRVDGERGPIFSFAGACLNLVDREHFPRAAAVSIARRYRL